MNPGAQALYRAADARRRLGIMRIRLADLECRKALGQDVDNRIRLITRHFNDVSLDLYIWDTAIEAVK